ncbi:MAG: putative RNA uridine N3 methyltransferase [Nitrosopumilaceae archaeon]
MEISVAVPDSSLIDESTQVEKTRKVYLIARPCSIFRVVTIYIYRESDGNKQDRFLLGTILRYLETPQYLRKIAFRKMDVLKFAGIMPPLKIAHHTSTPDIVKVKAGDTREGIVISSRGKMFVDVGLDKLIPYFGGEKAGKRITVKFKNGYPNLSIKEIPRSEVPGYWGYRVKESSNLRTLLSNWNHDVILTSRKGKPINLKKRPLQNNGNQTLVVFGSPRRGLHEILGKEIREIPRSHILNFFPNQATETVRLEEALLGTLAILNFFDSN